MNKKPENKDYENPDLNVVEYKDEDVLTPSLDEYEGEMP